MVACLVVAALVPTLASTASASAAASVPVKTGRAVTYRGWSAQVPAGWPVVDLAAHPTTCVRFDVHAVYLGQPGTQQACPSHLRGRTEALLVEPVETPSSDPAPQSSTVAIAASTLSPSSDAAQELRVAVPSAGVTVTATWGTERAAMTAVLATASPVSGWHPTSRQRPAAPAPEAKPQVQLQSQASSKAAASTSAAGPTGPFIGKAFDACTAPSLASMTAWLASPYRAVGVYIGGLNRACAQRNLTADWVAAVSRQGWRLVPIYVGLQAPYPLCGCRAMAPSQASAQGRAAAEDAVADARSVGIGPGATLFNDMEGYTRGATNTTGVLKFLAAWTARLHELGYRSGVYSGSTSGIRDIAAVQSTNAIGMPVPDVLWYARWNASPEAISDTYLPADRWTHQRMHQYLNATSTWGGVTINIDRNAVDATLTAAVRSPTPPVVPTPPRPVVSSTLANAWVRRAYAVILGRVPNTFESNSATWYISYGSSQAGFLTDLLASREWAARWASIEYRSILHRSPDSAGAAYWTAWLMRSRQPDVMAARLAASGEAFARAGHHADTFVRQLYRDVFNRTATAAKTAYWTRRLRSGASRLSVALAFTTGQYEVDRFVTNVYVHMLGRSPDPAGRAYWDRVYKQHFNPAAVIVPLGATKEAIGWR